MCQTGLNAGSSALAFLCATSNEVILHSFDLGKHEYVRTVHELMNKLHLNRHAATWGNSSITVAEKKNERGFFCDFVYVDGGHSYEVALDDIRNFKAISSPGTVVVIDDCNAFAKDHDFAGIPAVSKAYAEARVLGYLRHKKQISLGNCKPERTPSCREMCVGIYE